MLLDLFTRTNLPSSSLQERILSQVSSYDTHNFKTNALLLWYNGDKSDAAFGDFLQTWANWFPFGGLQPNDMAELMAFERWLLDLRNDNGETLFSRRNYTEEERRDVFERTGNTPWYMYSCVRPGAKRRDNLYIAMPNGRCSENDLSFEPPVIRADFYPRNRVKYSIFADTVQSLCNKLRLAVAGLFLGGVNA